MGFGLRVLDLARRDRAEAELRRVGADPAGVAKMRDKAATVALKAHGLRSPGANILKQEMLSLGGEVAVARGVVTGAAEPSDVVILGTRKQLLALARKLRPQPFGLRALGQEIEAALAPRIHELSWAGGVLRLSERPHVMGILNVTPDSFSDGGTFLDPQAALDRAVAMVEEGADLIDVGGESTRPGSRGVSVEEELARVIPVVEALAPRLGVPLSVDTAKAAVAERAVGAGAAIVNDVSGLTADPGMAGTVAAAGCALVVMHLRGTPQTMQADTTYGDLLAEVWAGLAASVERAEAAGVPRERVVVDPGIGFGKNPQGSLALLGRLGEFATLGCPLLIGASRKSFIGATVGGEGPQDRLEGSLAAAVVALGQGAQLFRVHDVRATRRALDLAWAALRAGGG